MNSRAFAHKQEALTSFKVVDFLDAAIRLQAQGIDVIRMEAGQPDFPLPPALEAAALKTLRNGAASYTAALGIAPLRNAIAGLYASRYGLDIHPDRIIVTTGSSAALAMICDLLLNPGDSMLLPDPGYPCNANFVRRCNADPVFIPVEEKDRFQLTAELVDQYWQPQTAGVMVASPSNPTGDTLTRADLGALAETARRRGGYLIVDEIYHGLNYAPEGDISVLNVADDAFVINSFSKYFGLPGWRLGWAVVPEQAIRPLEIMAQNFYISPPNLSQKVALAALSPECIELFEARREEFRQRRDFLVPALQNLGFHIHHPPPGAFYVYAGIEAFADDSEDFCWQMLEKANVAFTPGTDFGSHRARQHVRFSYTEPLPRLEQAVERLARALGDRREY